jgi:hypothetical protein
MSAIHFHGSVLYYKARKTLSTALPFMDIIFLWIADRSLTLSSASAITPVEDGAWIKLKSCHRGWEDLTVKNRKELM